MEDSQNFDLDMSSSDDESGPSPVPQKNKPAKKSSEVSGDKKKTQEANAKGKEAGGDAAVPVEAKDDEGTAKGTAKVTATKSKNMSNVSKASADTTPKTKRKDNPKDNQKDNPKRKKKKVISASEEEGDVSDEAPKKKRSTATEKNSKAKKESSTSEEDSSPPAKRPKRKKTGDLPPEVKKPLVVIDPSSELPKSDASWAVTFTNTRVFTEFVSMIASVLSDGIFNIVDGRRFRQEECTTSSLTTDKKKQGYTGLYVECIDSRKVCLLICKIYGHVITHPKVEGNEDDDEQLSFCVKIETLLTYLKSVGHGNYVQLYGLRNSPRLYMNVISATTARQKRHITIESTSHDSESFNVKDITYENTVYFEQTEFRNIIALASSKGVNCKNIRFRLMEPVKQSATGEHRLYFILHVYGENSSTDFGYCSTTTKDEETNSQCVVIKNSDSIDEYNDLWGVKQSELKETFNEAFSVEYLNSFVSSQSHTLVFRLSPKKPMIVTCSLGDEYSFISFVLAPRSDEEIPDTIQLFDA